MTVPRVCCHAAVVNSSANSCSEVVLNPMAPQRLRKPRISILQKLFDRMTSGREYQTFYSQTSPVIELNGKKSKIPYNRYFFLITQKKGTLFKTFLVPQSFWKNRTGNLDDALSDLKNSALTKLKKKQIRVLAQGTLFSLSQNDKIAIVSFDQSLSTQIPLTDIIDYLIKKMGFHIVFLGNQEEWNNNLSGNKEPRGEYVDLNFSQTPKTIFSRLNDRWELVLQMLLIQFYSLVNETYPIFSHSEGNIILQEDFKQLWESRDRKIFDLMSSDVDTAEVFRQISLYSEIMDKMSRFEIDELITSYFDKSNTSNTLSFFRLMIKLTQFFKSHSKMNLSEKWLTLSNNFIDLNNYYSSINFSFER